MNELEQAQQAVNRKNQEVFQQRYNARRRGELLSDNPYNNPTKRGLWKNGWIAAAKKETSHTPGPWRLGTLADNSCISNDYCSIVGGDGVYTNGGFSLTGFIGEANARLIAAAPELLEVCEMLVKAFDTGCPENLDCDTYYHLLNVINKAKGE